MSVVERVELEASFVLHARPYRESSQICEMLSQQHGRVGVVARGARRPRSPWRSLLQPFQPLRISWFGRGSLYTLRAAEPSSRPLPITGLALMSAYYLNELLMILMQRVDPHPELFAHYGAAIGALSTGEEPQRILRRFEVALLSEIGYGLVVDLDVIQQQPLAADRYYEYVIDRGPVPVDAGYDGDLVFSGGALHAIAAGELTNDEQLRNAKRLLRPLLDRALGGKPLKTREVLAAMLR
ncbi:MAG: DNA repair protein RecO [Gammaproteobacteria bacterium]|nr:MAG: DNA repair protein RecO [Gammaproteobacteria bacterium]